MRPANRMGTTDTASLRLQAIVFALVSASFTHIYITQPVLPLLQREFATDLVTISLTVAAVIFGIALANLPFGALVDRMSIHPIIAAGGTVVALGGLICALTSDLRVFIAARFLQGLFIPALTTCLAAYLAKTLPAERLNVVMGTYVSATVLGGLGGRLLGGWIHPPLHWRYAFVSASLLILVVTAAALWGLPRTASADNRQTVTVRFASLCKRWDLLRIYLCAAGSFAIFSSIFNYLPFRLAGPPFHFSTELTTLLYSVYIVGIIMGPAAGRVSNRLGSGYTLIGGCIFLGVALGLLLRPSTLAVICGLILTCAGFFTVHAAAVGSLNRKLSSGQGKANALYVLAYYTGGWIGIACTGIAYKMGDWQAVVLLCVCLLLIPLSAGIGEYRSQQHTAEPPGGF